LADQNKKTILVVDDELDIVIIFKAYLQKCGWIVKEFTDPVLAFQHFEQNPAECTALLSDMRMPDMNGFELARKVKAANPEIKIFLMSAFELSPSELEKVLPSVKVDGMIEKPGFHARACLSNREAVLRLRKY
jgi:CheY-like chemotaxis protein